MSNNNKKITLAKHRPAGFAAGKNRFPFSLKCGGADTCCVAGYDALPEDRKVEEAEKECGHGKTEEEEKVVIL